MRVTRSISLLPAAVLLGRESGDWVFPYDQTMSGRHAEIRSQDAEFFVHDAGSRNGVALGVRGEQTDEEGPAFPRSAIQTLRVESVGQASQEKICPTCGTEYPANERFCPRDGTALRSASGSTDLVGSIIAERYHVIKKLGEGGMGTVYLAEHVKMGRKSAVKVMNPGMVHDADAISRFNREAANASRINHPNVAGIYDFGETSEGLIYLAMEFIEGESLTSLIEKNRGLSLHSRARRSSIRRRTRLQVAHEFGIVHRDLKPDNIMIAKDRDGADVVKVVDFGIAEERVRATRTRR